MKRIELSVGEAIEIKLCDTPYIIDGVVSDVEIKGAYEKCVSLELVVIKIKIANVVPCQPQPTQE